MRTKIGRNRANGKAYEGELVKELKQRGIYARLGRSNEEYDITLPELNINIELKSTNRELSWKRKDAADQYSRLRKVPGNNYYGIRWKGKGIKGLHLYPISDIEKPPVLYRSEGITFEEFVFLSQSKMEQIKQKKEQETVGKE